MSDAGDRMDAQVAKTIGIIEAETTSISQKLDGILNLTDATIQDLREIGIANKQLNSMLNWIALGIALGTIGIVVVMLCIPAFIFWG